MTQRNAMVAIVTKILKDLKIPFNDPCDPFYEGDCICDLSSTTFYGTEGLTDTPITGVLGDLYYYDGSNLVALPMGTTGQILGAVTGGIPTWTNGAGGVVTFFSLPDTPASASTGSIFYYNGVNVVELLPGTTGQILNINASGIPEWVDDPNFVYGEFISDEDAATNGVPLEGTYQMHPDNIYGIQSGFLKKRKS